MKKKFSSLSILEFILLLHRLFQRVGVLLLCNMIKGIKSFKKNFCNKLENNHLKGPNNFLLYLGERTFSAEM